MCGFVGFVNYNKDISKEKDIIEKMNNTILQRGPDEFGYYSDTNVMLGHRRLIVRDPVGGKQPMIEKYSFGEYVIVYNGQIYNTKELKEYLHLQFGIQKMNSYLCAVTILELSHFFILKLMAILYLLQK